MMLETDYKLMTKILAKRLGKVAQKLIHKDQAGFIPGRNLYDHVKLAQLMPDYTEKEEMKKKKKQGEKSKDRPPQPI